MFHFLKHLFLPRIHVFPGEKHIVLEEKYESLLAPFGIRKTGPLLQLRPSPKIASPSAPRIKGHTLFHEPQIPSGRLLLSQLSPRSA